MPKKNQKRMKKNSRRKRKIWGGGKKQKWKKMEKEPRKKERKKKCVRGCICRQLMEERKLIMTALAGRSLHRLDDTCTGTSTGLGARSLSVGSNIRPLAFESENAGLRAHPRGFSLDFNELQGEWAQQHGQGSKAGHAVGLPSADELLAGRVHRGPEFEDWSIPHGLVDW
jgi:hypothetical protein